MVMSLHVSYRDIKCHYMTENFPIVATLIISIGIVSDLSIPNIQVVSF